MVYPYTPAAWLWNGVAGGGKKDQEAERSRPCAGSGMQTCLLIFAHRKATLRQQAGLRAHRCREGTLLRGHLPMHMHSGEDKSPGPRFDLFTVAGAAWAWRNSKYCASPTSRLIRSSQAAGHLLKFFSVAAAVLPSLDDVVVTHRCHRTTTRSNKCRYLLQAS